MVIFHCYVSSPEGNHYKLIASDINWGHIPMFRQIQITMLVVSLWYPRVISQYITIYWVNHHRIRISANSIWIKQYLLMISLYIMIYHYISLYIILYHYISLYIITYIIIYHCISYTIIYHCISLHISLYIIVYHYIYHYISLHIKIYHCI